MISDEDKERVRQATDFVQLVAETVELRQRGQDFWGCCPFHGEKTPSFKVNPSTGLWHCFGCGEGGDVFSYVQRRENLEFADAVRYLADRAGIELAEERGQRGPRKSRLMEALEEAEAFYHLMLMRGRGQDAAAARSYFAGRGFGADVCRRWRLGYAPGRGALVAHLRDKGFSPAELVAADLAQERGGRLQDRFWERVMFPIHDERGRAIAFGGRILAAQKREGVAKYVNTRDTAAFNKGRHLFAYDRARDGMAATGEALVCEGYTDVIALHEAGFTNAVAALGTAFRLEHVRLMERQRVSRIVCLFDGDAAGQRAAERAIRYLDKTSASLMCVVLPDGQDPMEFLAAHGAEAMRRELDGARPLMDFVFEKRLASYDLSGPGRRVRALEDMAGLLAPLKHSVLLDEYATQLADALGMDVDETKRAIRSAPVRELDEERERPARRAAAPTGAPAPAPLAGAGDAYDEAPADYVPLEAFEGGGTPVAVPAAPVAEAVAAGPLSADERMQVAAERELLCAIAQRPDELRPFGARIAGLSWADGRHEAMAWAMLSTPEGSTPVQVVAAASAVVAEAPQILSGGRVMGDDELTGAQKLEFIVDNAELCSCRRRIRQIRARLRSAGADSDALFAEATSLQRRVNELSARLSSVFGS